jgi:flagellar protein FliS
MPANHYQTYFEDEIMEADPITLVRLVYQAVFETIGQARRHLSCGAIAERSAAISKAIALLQELAVSVNHDNGGEIGRNLVELYDYIQRQLIQSNIHQSDAPMAEAERLVTTLLEGWLACCTQAAANHPSLSHTSFEEPGVSRSLSVCL